MKLKYKILVLAIVPLLAAIIALAVLVARHTQRLGDEQARLVESSLMRQKREELVHAVTLVRNEVDAIRTSERDDSRARAHAKALIAAARYGHNGYFFVNDGNGVLLVNPIQPELVGKNLSNVTDPRGLYVTRSLLAAAQHGDGFQRYLWNKPSTGRVGQKLAYVTWLRDWGWLLGTGVYLDDVARATAVVRQRARESVARTMHALAWCALLALAVVFAGAMTLNVHEQRLADAKLRALNHELVALNERLDGVRERERARVSGELHDGITQALAAVKYNFELVRQRLAAQDEEGAVSLDRGLASLGECIAEVRRISHELYPRELELGLPVALTRLADDVAKRSGMQVMFHDDFRPPLPSPRQSLTLFRAVQEALTNVERHAAAHHIDIELSRREVGAELCLRVTDDGRGFDTTILNDIELSGIGLCSLRRRVEDLGGVFRVESRPGRTELCVNMRTA